MGFWNLALCNAFAADLTQRNGLVTSPQPLNREKSFNARSPKTGDAGVGGLRQCVDLIRWLGECCHVW